MLKRKITLSLGARACLSGSENVSVTLWGAEHLRWGLAGKKQVTFQEKSLHLLLVFTAQQNNTRSYERDFF